MDVERSVTEWLRRKSPPGTATSVGQIGHATPFDAVEESVISKAVRRRREQFLTGRMLARNALAALGCPPVSIACGVKGEPEWPPGFVGSISHTNEFCVAQAGQASALAGIGIDLEFANPLPDDLINIVCAPGEPELATSENSVGVDLPKLCFVAKEAIYKAYFPWTRTFLEFSDLSIEADLERSRFVGRLTRQEKPSIEGYRRFEGYFQPIGNHLIAAVWIHRATAAADNGGPGVS